MHQAARWRTGLLGFGLLGFLVGCSGTSSGPAPVGPGGGPAAANAEDFTGPHAAGKKVYAANNCSRCHSGGVAGGAGRGGPGGPPMAGAPRGPGGPGGPPMAGPPGGPGGPGGRGRGMGRGPDLAHVGKEHPLDWLKAHIRNPKDHKPDSRMPAFGPNKISDTDLQALAEYLASLK